MEVRRIGLVVHHGRVSAVATAQVAPTWARARGVPVVDLDI